MRKKGFTLVELLVVIAIIALLMGILMPALARVKTIAYRMVCGTNLSGIGKAILLYAGDAKEEYPMPGIDKKVMLSQSGKINDFADCATQGPSWAYATDKATIGSLFYLLVKYEDVSVKQFNCKGDTGVRTFKLTDFTDISCLLEDFTKAWDFGKRPGIYNSYSYHTPFGDSSSSPPTPSYAVNSNSPPSAPLAADRNPSLDLNVTYLTGGTTQGGTANEAGKSTPYTRWVTPSGNEYKDPDIVYNSFAHGREGQNVLFNDGHVRLEKTANVGVDSDNIWQKWPNAAPAKIDRETGGYFPLLVSTDPEPPQQVYSTVATMVPFAIGDSLLISEPQNTGDPFPTTAP
jgi:prepilin-type N-terminal cleavage/methylation domain-containing protein/prepilin-type processing-associated H-X9-DG protein